MLNLGDTATEFSYSVDKVPIRLTLSLEQSKTRLVRVAPADFHASGDIVVRVTRDLISSRVSDVRLLLQPDQAQAIVDYLAGAGFRAVPLPPL